MTVLSSPVALPLALVAGTMVLAVAACGGPSDVASSPTPAPTTTAATTAPAGGNGATPSTTSSGASASASSTPTTAGDGACGVGSLRIRYADDEGGAGAGSVTGTFTFTNTGTTACTLAGFPGVSYVGGGNGTQVGEPATRTSDAVRSRRLEPDTSVKAALRRTQPRNYGEECQQAPVDGFRVYPPGSTEAALVTFPTQGCRSTSVPLLQVGPVR